MIVCIGNNDTAKNVNHSYYPNLYTLHSFVGLGAIILYGTNYLLGFANFLLYPVLGISNEVKAAYLPLHVFIGTFALFAAGKDINSRLLYYDSFLQYYYTVCAVESGIMELTSELIIDDYPACSYEVDSADVNPARHYSNLPSKCALFFLSIIS